MHRTWFERRSRCILIVAVLLAGCGGPGAGAVPPGSPRELVRVGRLTDPIDKIDHVVIVVQENRSFNNLFYGFPGATTVTYGYDSKNKQVKIKPVDLATTWDLAHNSQAFYDACNGTGSIPGTNCQMNGFNRVTAGCGQPSYPACPIKYPSYSYVPHSETTPYFTMGKQYVVADQMYASNFDMSSYVSHQYTIAAQAAQTTNYPAANWGCPGGPYDTIPTITTNPPRGYGASVVDCFDYQTLGDELDAAGLSWAFYANPLGIVGAGGTKCGTGVRKAYGERGIWSSYQAVKHICYGPDWNDDVITPPSQFLTDVAGGSLRAVTWITPTCANSDHPGCNSDTGPSWVTSIVNAVGESPFWDSTAIFIFWDDPGGLYDPEPPAYLDYDGLGMRVPMLIISPYAKRGWVSHVPYEHGSILRFIENRFNLGQLAASDTRATSPENDCFDFSRRPRKFVPITSKYSEGYFLHQPRDYRPPDAN
jgi:phospholipase C